MRFDHIVVTVDNDPHTLKNLQAPLKELGYPFEPDSGRRSLTFQASNINIGNEYIEVVRFFKRGGKYKMPFWATAYEEGQRGAFCIFMEVDDVERTAVALKKAGIAARGPAVLSYPYLMGLVQVDAPYFIYYLPRFPDSTLQIALMQYRKPGQREALQSRLTPNADQNGIHGIRRIEVDLPNLEESLPMLQKVFPDLQPENGGWLTLAGKARLFFCASKDDQTHVRLHTITSQRKLLGQTFQLENVEVKTTGG